MQNLTVRLNLNSSQFNSGVSSAGSSLGTLKSKISDIGKGLKSVGKKMTAIGSGMVASVAGIVAKGSEWSASVESTQFLYNNLDKAVQKSIESNKVNAKVLGMTEQQYKNNATTIATYYKNMGLAGEESAKLSEDTMNLAADLAAVADVPVDEALRDVKSALMGNYEAVDKYGVSLSANALENSEYVKSLGKSWNQLSDNEKMMAAYNEITRQSSSAQGLAKQEASSFGMQMKLLKESIGEAVGKLGSTLLPVLEPVAKKFQEVTEKVTKWIEENPKLAQAILMVVGGLGLFLAVVGPLVIGVGMLAVAIGGLSTVSWPVVGAVTAITLAISSLVAAGVWLYANWDTVKAKAAEIWNNIKESISTIINTIKTVISNVWNDIHIVITNVLNTIKSIVTSVWNGIKTIITTYVNIIKAAITTAFNLIKSTITTVLNTVKSVISSVWNNIKSIFTISCNSIKNTVSNVFNGLKSTVSTALNGVLNTARNIWDSITGIFSKPIKAVVSVFKKEGKSMSIPQTKAMTSKAFSSGYSAAGAMSSYSRSNLNGLNSSSSSPISLNANLNSFVQLDGKTLARASAPYMSSELDKLNKRKNRLGGVLS